jgi:hypothetical protein
VIVSVPTPQQESVDRTLKPNPPPAAMYPVIVPLALWAFPSTRLYHSPFQNTCGLSKNEPSVVE